MSLHVTFTPTKLAHLSVCANFRESSFYSLLYFLFTKDVMKIRQRCLSRDLQLEHTRFCANKIKEVIEMQNFDSFF